ncbi:TetR/AcrR family transcriptional regulator [Moritella sp. 36]|uniref:TetR/AcrR family transcriptional regulator n=1 Tax=Moritella sp. 36 TaxID=2746233 RepID=UPI001BADC711|nr:TetR/AcrR family transcriptional regulator [Moritella sp. 36]QUM89339.1 TetR/AcrR family transcriptional regulator [Moritella sp. 36]
MQKEKLTLNRSQKRIVKAFTELLREKDYCDISVAMIIEKADVGKTTFYRYYQRKLEVLLAMHDGIFDQLLQDLTSKDDWLSNEARPSVSYMLNIFSNNSNFRRPMNFKLDKDWPQALLQLKTKLANCMAVKLANALDGCSMKIPISVLSTSLAAIYVESVVQLVKGLVAFSVNKQALYLQYLTRSLVIGAIES